MKEEPIPRVELAPDSLVLGDDRLPLLAGSVHYFRLARRAFRPALEALREMGATLVDVPMPWGVHEKTRGVFDFGEDNPRLDIVHFLDIASEVGLRALVRVGPYIGAELTFGGLPERLVWDPRCQARSAGGAPVIVPALPVSHPVPSPASRVYQDELALWLRRAAEQLAPLAWPEGPVVAVDTGDALAAAARVSVYDADYHADAIEQYRRFLRARHRTVPALRRIHGATATFENVEPPPRLDTNDPDALAPHLEWAEFQDALVETSLYRSTTLLNRHGLRGPVKLFSVGRESSAAPLLDEARLDRSFDLVAPEFRGRSSEAARVRIARAATRLVARSETRRGPAFAVLGAGFAPDARSTTPEDDAFTLLTALAYGVRGFTLCEAVQHDRWIGGPVDPSGSTRPSAEFFKRLSAALRETKLAGLTRRTPVRIVLPRVLGHLVRVCHALGPFSGLPFGVDVPEDTNTALEGDADPTRGALTDALAFLSTLEVALGAARIPYACIDTAGFDRSIVAKGWTIVVSPGALDPSLTGKIAHHMLLGSPLSVGPRAPERDATFAASSTRLPNLERPAVPHVLPKGPATLKALIETTAADLGIQPLAVEPDFVHTTLFEDPEGRQRVLFVVNPSAEAAEVHASVNAVPGTPAVRTARDALSDERFTFVNERVTLPVGARTVRFLALSGDP